MATTNSIDNILGVATATSIAFNPTTGGIVGTTTNNNADAGKVGEFVTSQILSSSAVSLVTNTAKDITSISLTAGDWDVYANVNLTYTGSTSYLAGWVSTTSATGPDSALVVQASILGGTNAWGAVVPFYRVSVNGTTTVYLQGFATFTTGAVSGSGGIFARRVR